MIWDKELECSSNRKNIEDIQLQRFRNIVKKVYENVPFYKQRLDNTGITPDKITAMRDIENIPFTTKNDIRDTYPFGLFAEPMKNIIRVHASSGTTGKPTVVGYTKGDVDMWSTAMARLVCAAGGTDEDIAQISFGYGLFTGALGLHYALEKVGAAVIPVSSGNTERQIMLMQDFGTTLLVATPSYAMYIAEVMEELKIDKSMLKLKLGLFGAEGSTEEMRQQLERRLSILVTENYGLSEIVGPGVSGECYEKCGMHINEDMFYCEIIDPDTGKVLPYGEKGELVITTLLKEGIPLLRYRTRDITYLIPEQCKCGRTSIRMAKIQGRTDDMLIIKGVNVFPSQIESVILEIPQISPNYQLVVRREGAIDTLELVVELIDASLLEKFSELEKLGKAVRHKVHTVLGLDLKVKLSEPKSIERTTGKAKRVVDLRNVT